MRLAKSVIHGIATGLLLLTLSCIVLLPPISSIGAPSGEVTSVSGTQTFHMKGGDPATGDGGFSLVASAVFDSLVSPTVEQNYAPSLAKSWKISPDWKYIDFSLRDDVKFQNGDPFTAEDVKFSLETYMRRELRFWLQRLYSKNIKQIEIKNPYQVRLHLTEPWPWILTNFWYHTGMLPKKYRETVGDAGFADKPVGTGPFNWMEYKQDVYFKLGAVQHHFRKTPEIKTLTVRFVPEASTRLAMLKAGEADIVELASPLIPPVKSDPNLKLFFIKHTQGLGLWFCDLVFPNEPSPFLDIRVREAASLAVDRATICEKILFGGAEPMKDYLAPITLGYNPNAPADSYHPEKAKALMAAAGYAKGFETTIHALPPGQAWVEAVASNLMEVGIRPKIEIYELGALLEKFKAKNLRGLGFPGIVYWNPDRHPGKDGSNFWTRGQTWCYNSTPEIEAAVQKSIQAASDEEIAKYGRMMADQIRASRLMLPLWSTHVVFGLTRKIKEWQPVQGVPMGTRYEYLKVGN
jgi:peptide/nickel transport system substrate-binding protein